MKWKPPYVFRGFWVKLFIASVRPVKLCCPTKLCILQLMKEEFCFTIWGRKIHPFDNNNNHVSAAQLRKYPKWKKKKKKPKHLMIPQKIKNLLVITLDKRWYLTVWNDLSSKWCLGGGRPLDWASFSTSRLFLQLSAIFSNLHRQRKGDARGKEPEN